MRRADLRLDFDRKRPPVIEDALYLVCRYCGWNITALSWRRTENGWHVEVFLVRPITPLRAIAAQAILGSDWRREALNLAKWRRRHPRGSLERQEWNVLFTRKIGGNYA